MSEDKKLVVVQVEPPFEGITEKVKDASNKHNFQGHVAYDLFYHFPNIPYPPTLIYDEKFSYFDKSFAAIVQSLNEVMQVYDINVMGLHDYLLQLDIKPELREAYSKISHQPGYEAEINHKLMKQADALVLIPTFRESRDIWFDRLTNNHNQHYRFNGPLILVTNRLSRSIPSTIETMAYATCIVNMDKIDCDQGDRRKMQRLGAIVDSNLSEFNIM